MDKPKYQHKVAVVDINKVHRNEYNPNVMDERIYEQTKKNILREGFIGAIVVREDPKQEGNYIIIDGEHRWKAAKETGYTEIPIIILDKNLPEAMVSTINFNKLKGEFDTLKLAEVIHELNKTYSIEELEEKLGYTPDEIKGLENLLKFDYDQFEDESRQLDEGAPKEYRFEVILTSKQYEAIEQALGLAGGGDNAEGITIICLDFIKKYAKKKPDRGSNPRT